MSESSRRRILVMTVLVVAASGAFYFSRQSATRVKRTRILTQADQVQAFRLSPSATGNNKIGRYVVAYEASAQGAQFAARINSILPPELKEPAQADSSELDCLPRPGVLFRIHHKREYVDLVLCFDCGELAMLDETQTDQWAPWKDFGAARPALVALVKQAFPNDPEIQKLQDTG